MAVVAVSINMVEDVWTFELTAKRILIRILKRILVKILIRILVKMALLSKDEEKEI